MHPIRSVDPSLLGKDVEAFALLLGLGLVGEYLGDSHRDVRLGVRRLDAVVAQQGV